MSSTNRGAKKIADEFYVTPPWCVDRLLDALPLHRLRAQQPWCEPCAGDGAIIRAVNARSILDGVAPPVWRAHEKRAEERSALLEVVEPHDLRCPEDTLQISSGWPAAVVMMNPPFSLTMEFLLWSLRTAPLVAMLQKLNWLGSADRNEHLKANAPDVYVLPDRPSFTEEGTSDSIVYGWFVWDGLPKRRGILEVLNTTPLEVRQAQKRSARRGLPAPSAQAALELAGARL